MALYSLDEFLAMFLKERCTSHQCSDLEWYKIKYCVLQRVLTMLPKGG